MVDTSSTPSGQCAACRKTTNLKRCAKCKTTQYCSQECQKTDWKEHKKSCSKNAPDRSNPSFSTGGSGRASAGIAAIDKPFTALSKKKWLHNRPEAEVYALLIDIYRMRVEDDYKFSGDVDMDSIYGGAPNGFAGFRRFLRQVERKPGLLPDWWSKEKAAVCVRHGKAVAGAT
ncbi:hypothetical protein A1O3_00228 [Capronia epimyces CBS 606.96]|uniref:MYND-type domain-containing protein n=1 Tax=Capronia epimyces CBS 606.96 TaxID=1182542 RepID=W9YGK0_9EURO|nr:uncharacterized protein A1O3_00228 [Capronia epimyces CBS 606.96]EXJ91678.1 hypothetical protein A1O3_00228 [Capronia epimyces CBS 606.96]